MFQLISLVMLLLPVLITSVKAEETVPCAWHERRVLTGGALIDFNSVQSLNRNEAFAVGLEAIESTIRDPGRIYGLDSTRRWTRLPFVWDDELRYSTTASFGGEVWVSCLFLSHPETTSRTLLLHMDRSGLWHQHFTASSMPSTLGISSIHFCSAKRGWICGVGVYRTDDGGENWVPKNKGLALHNPFGVYFYDTEIGYAYSWGVWKTTDGGENWQRISDAPGWFTTSENAFAFITPKWGWFVGRNQLYTTADGMKTWSVVPLPSVGYVRAVQLVEKKHLWVLCYTGYGDRSYFLRSKDFGKTWERFDIGEKWINSFHFSAVDCGLAVGNSDLLEFGPTSRSSAWKMYE